MRKVATLERVFPGTCEHYNPRCLPGMKVNILSDRLPLLDQEVARNQPDYCTVTYIRPVKVRNELSPQHAWSQIEWKVGLAGIGEVSHKGLVQSGWATEPELTPGQDVYLNVGRPLGSTAILTEILKNVGRFCFACLGFLTGKKRADETVFKVSDPTRDILSYYICKKKFAIVGQDVTAQESGGKYRIYLAMYPDYMQELSEHLGVDGLLKLGDISAELYTVSRDDLIKACPSLSFINRTESPVRSENAYRN